MANQEHIEIIKKGVSEWNRWRREHPKIKPNLRGANLEGANLKFINLMHANLVNINLIDANLVEADLRNADLKGADMMDADVMDATLNKANLVNTDLRGINFTGAHLMETNLTNSDLRDASFTNANLIDARLRYANFTDGNLSSALLINADLSDAILGGTNLNGADLGSANFYQVTLKNTVLVNVNLSTTKYLTTCKHYGQSIVNNRTLELSGTLPVRFLRGVGLSEWEIETTKLYDPNLIDQQTISEVLYNIYVKRTDVKIQFESIFISYQTGDKETFVNKLHDDLQNCGVRCWYAPHDLQGGEKIHRQIEEAIHLLDRVLLVLSETSIKSNWVEYEIRTARKRERRESRRILYPITLIPCEKLKSWQLFDADEGRDLAAEIREYYIPDFSKEANYNQEFAKLLKSLRKTSFGS